MEGTVICLMYTARQFSLACTYGCLGNIKGVVYTQKQVLKALSAADDLPSKLERKANHACHNIPLWVAFD